MKHIKLLIFAVLTLLLSSCVGDMLKPKEDPTVFFVLSSSDSVEKIKIEGVDINFYPVMIPAYMDRTSLVSLDSDKRVSISDIAVWAELPSAAVARVMTQDILSKFDGDIEIFSYPVASMSKKPMILRVFIYDCIGKLGEDLKFSSRWELSLNDKTLSKAYNTQMKTTNSYDSYVDAINKALKGLSDDISAGILEFSKEVNK